MITSREGSGTAKRLWAPLVLICLLGFLAQGAPGRNDNTGGLLVLNTFTTVRRIGRSDQGATNLTPMPEYGGAQASNRKYRMTDDPIALVQSRRATKYSRISKER
eukprot:1082297-Pyramimonas_sp.AAC.1